MGRYGGLEGFVLALANGVTRTQDSQVDLLFKQTAGFNLGTDLEERIRQSGIAAKFCAKSSSALLGAIRRADVVHVQNPCPDVVLAARALRKPLLINVINHSKGGRSVHGLLWKICLRLANLRFYISDFVRRTWEHSVTPWKGSRVVFPICDLAPLEPLPIGQRRGFVFVARWIENKGLDTLVEAYASAGLDRQQWPLYLLGDGPLRPRIEARLRELNADGIQMPGFMTEQDKWERLRSSRFAVIPPNTQEDFGLVAIEARHLGVPCIISRDGGLPEAAGRHVLTCEPGNVGDLTRVLREAAAMSDEQYEKMAEGTLHELQGELVRPAFYAERYHELAGTSRHKR